MDKDNEWWIEELEKPCPHYTSLEDDILISLRCCRACDMCIQDIRNRVADDR